MRTIQSEFKSLQDNQRLLAILIFSLVTVVIWVGFSLVGSQSRSTISPELAALATPLNPNISTEVLDTIQQQRAYSPEELQNFPIYSIQADNQEPSVFSHGAVAQPVTVPGKSQTTATSSAQLGSPVITATASASPSATPVTSVTGTP